MSWNATLGQNQTAMSGRVCLPCPPLVNCSQLAVVDAPHSLIGSRYPASNPVHPANPLLRRFLPFAVTVPCLHPLVCNMPSEFVTDTWSEWAALAAAGDTDSAAFGEFRCRTGHLTGSLLCSRCADGYWADGFLCQRCSQASGPLALVFSLLCLGLLAAYVYHKARLQTSGAPARDAHADSGAGGDDYVMAVWTQPSRVPRAEEAAADEQTIAIALWYLQVSAVLGVSSQINAAQSSRGAADGSDASPLWFSALDDMSSFMPAGAECLLGSGWDMTSSSAALLLLPWALCLAGALLMWLVPRHALRWSSAVCILLDLLYIPVAARCTQWFNVTSVHGQVPLRARIVCAPGQGDCTYVTLCCHTVRLAPDAVRPLRHADCALCHCAGCRHIRHLHHWLPGSVLDGAVAGRRAALDGGACALSARPAALVVVAMAVGRRAALRKETAVRRDDQRLGL